MTWPIFVPRPLRRLHVVIMSTTFKLPPSPHAHPVHSHSIPWALLPHLHSEERGSIVRLRVKAYFTCLQMRASHLGLMELISIRMFKLYSGSSILSNPVPKCYLQPFQLLSALSLHLKRILLLHLTARCSQSAGLLRRPLVILRVLCSKTRLIRKSFRIHPSSDSLSP